MFDINITVTFTYHSLPRWLTSQCCPSSSSAKACRARCFHPRGANVEWEPSDGTTLSATEIVQQISCT